MDWKEQGLEVVAKVDNLDDNVALLLKTRLGPGVTTCSSLTPVYRGADWMERECFDMFGIRFENHRDLRRGRIPRRGVRGCWLQVYRRRPGSPRSR